MKHKFEKHIVILSEGSLDLLDRFEPLIRELRTVVPNSRVGGIFYFKDHQIDLSSKGIFDEIKIVTKVNELKKSLAKSQASKLLVFVKHNSSVNDVIIYKSAKNFTSGDIAYLQRNLLSLRNYLVTGEDEKKSVSALINKEIRKNIEIHCKVYPLFLLVSVILPILRLASGLLFTKNKDKKHKILFIRLDVLGDMVLTLPALKALRECYPGSELSVLASKRGSALLYDQQTICAQSLFDRLVVWESPWHSKKNVLLGIRDFIRMMRFLASQWKENYDMVIQPVELGTGVLFSTLFLARDTISIIAERLPLAKLMSRHVTSPVFIPTYALYHIADLPNYAVSKAGVEDDAIRNFLFKSLCVSEESISNLLHELYPAGYHGKKTLVLINVGAGHKNRRWDTNKFALLCDQLNADKEVFLVIIGGPEEADIANEVAAKCGVNPLNLAGRLSLNDLIALVSLAELIVTSDTGVMHLAASLNKKIVALFGAGLVPFCRPLCDEYAIVRSDLGCSGCGDVCFSDGNVPCISLIEVDEVYDAVKQLLSRKNTYEKSIESDLFSRKATIGSYKTIARL